MTKKRRREQPGPPPADIEIGAVAKAKKLRFNSKPETKLEFPDSAETSGSHTERKNLPDEVEPGVTYRDVEVRWRARRREGRGGRRRTGPADSRGGRRPMSAQNPF
jgi:hypothetical protein